MNNSWIIDEIDNLCNVEYGTRVVKKKHGGNIYPVYGGGGATFFMDSYNRENRLTIARFAMSEKCTRFVRGKFFLNDSGLTLSPKNTIQLDQDFLDYQCLALNDVFYSLAKGSAQKNLDVPSFRKLKLNIPKDKGVQKKIVEKLDAIFAEIDKARAAAEANAKNAEVLFQSYLNSIFKLKGNNWITAKLNEICEKITDGTHQTPTYFDDGVIFLSSKNVTTGKIDWGNIKYIDTKQHIEMSKSISPKVGDILLAKNGTTGVAAMVDKDIVFNIYVSLALLRAKEQILPKLLLYFINSPVAKKQFNSRLKGSGVPNLHLQEIRQVEISFPKSLENQRELILQIESFLDATSILIAKYKNKKNEILLLKQAILKQAFNGKLVKAA